MPRDLLNHLTEYGLGSSVDFFRCERLDGMLHQDDREIRQAERLGLGERSIGKLGRGKHRRRDTRFFKKDSVVHTARCTRPSIG